MAALKQEPTFLYGDFEYVLVTDEVFSFTRKAEGQDSYVIVMNLGNRDLNNVNLHYAGDLPMETEIALFFGKDESASQELANSFKIGDKIGTKRMSIKSGACFILKY